MCFYIVVVVLCVCFCLCLFRCAVCVLSGLQLDAVSLVFVVVNVVVWYVLCGYTYVEEWPVGFCVSVVMWFGFGCVLVTGDGVHFFYGDRIYPSLGLVDIGLCVGYWGWFYGDRI